MAKEVLVLAVVGSLVLEDYVAVTRLSSRLSWRREPGNLSCSSPWWKWWIMGMVEMLESVRKLRNVLERVESGGKW